MHEILQDNLIILASAGSGKTYQLVNRMIGLIGIKGAEPHSIVALTFTRKAAGEFADSILSRLSKAALDQKEAGQKLFDELGGEFDIEQTLEKVVRELPKLELGTIDSFFAKIVRSFQYDLGLTEGEFELVHGTRLKSRVGEILHAVIYDSLQKKEAEEFLHAFRRSTHGRGTYSVMETLENYVKEWHGLWKQKKIREIWKLGEEIPVSKWEEQKLIIIEKIRDTIPKEAEKSLNNVLDKLAKHSIGSGSLNGLDTKASNALFDSLSHTENIEYYYYNKPIALDAMTSQQCRELMHLLVQCELNAAEKRTQAILDLIRPYHEEWERQLWQQGALGFDDIKLLMGQWKLGETERLKSLDIYFRLDAKYNHWLLDEFQDTSQMDWDGLKPLIDEAAMDPEPDHSLFIVGDKKQAIYGWRGGDVRLFDHVQSDFQMSAQSMQKSFRSCEAVLDLVNEVCGADEFISQLFGPKVTDRWMADWQNHVSAKKNVSGYSHVEIVGAAVDVDERYEKMWEWMQEIGIGEKNIECGILMRKNDEVKEVAEFLRSKKIDVLEEGNRKPGEDNPVGVAMVELLGWLANPADSYSRQVIAMSPLEEVLCQQYKNSRQRWESLLEVANTRGYAVMLEELIQVLWDDLSEFGRGRAMDIITALAEFDAAGMTGARAARQWVEGLEVSQAPGAASVQVMTIHKSKGLGFDVVIIPNLNDDSQVGGRYDMSLSSKNEVLQNPPKWVQEQLPELATQKEAWLENEAYEALCVLYVAITRAKRGLYVMFGREPGSRKDKETFATPGNLFRQALGLNQEENTIWKSGDPKWSEQIEPRKIEKAEKIPPLRQAQAKRKHITPSEAGAEDEKVTPIAGTAGGRAFGSTVHELFEQVEWIDDKTPQLPDTEAGRLIKKVLQTEELAAGFRKNGKNVQLYREQPIEAMMDEKWLSGIIDRLHVYDNGAQVEVIDFKTDQVNSPEELRERYQKQMTAYRRVLKMIYPKAQIQCRLLSTKLMRWVEVS